MIHIPYTQKWASGSDPTLLFGERTERRYFYKRYGVLGLIFHKYTGDCMLL